MAAAEDWLNKFETVFGSNGALLGLGIIKASFASALDFRYLCSWLHCYWLQDTRRICF